MAANRAARTPLNAQWLSGQMVVSDIGTASGKRFYVDSGQTSTGGNGGGFGVSPDAPKLDLNEIFTDAQVTASNGDVIYCMSGHAQNLTADSSIDMDIAGVKVVGLGEGSARPTFTCTVVAGDFKLATAGSVIENLLFLNDIDNSTGLLEVSGADCVIRNCEIREANAAKFADILILTVDGCDRLLIDGLRVIGNAADGAVSAISVDGCDDLEIKNSYIFGDFSTSNIDFATTASNRVRIHKCLLWNDDATGGADAVQVIKDTITGSTGTIGPDIEIRLGVAAANVTGAVTGATFHVFDPVYVVNDDNEKAMLINWTPTTD